MPRNIGYPPTIITSTTMPATSVKKATAAESDISHMFQLLNGSDPSCPINPALFCCLPRAISTRCEPWDRDLTSSRTRQYLCLLVQDLDPRRRHLPPCRISHSPDRARDCRYSNAARA